MFNLSILQFSIDYKNPESNRKKVRELVSKASASGSDMLILPETWTTGYSEEIFHDIMSYAEKEDGPTVTMMRELAQKNKVYIVGGSIPEYDGQNVYNTIFFIDKSGDIIGKYHKMHLYSAMDEDKAFKNGSEMPVFDTELGKIALMTCYDIRFPELSRTYAVRGAQIIITVANFPKPKVHHWRTLLQARAIENQMFIAACNRVGSAGSCSYFGHSIIIDPWGEILAEAEEEETILVAGIDFSAIEKVRTLIPMYYDRQPQAYPDDILKVQR